MFPNGNVANSIPQSIELYVADGTKAMSYSKDSLEKLTYKEHQIMGISTIITYQVRILEYLFEFILREILIRLLMDLKALIQSNFIKKVGN
ncbi:hypothetical protein [Streptococcus suis]|uniref:hypothetical protein n=1 Tax=Streptococcus suis TaxID=1307 RepID=UPI003A4D85F9